MDLFVNGTSVASGVGCGHEEFRSIGDGDITTSWPHFLANKLHCENLWNHSLPSKPMSFTIADTIGFCEQYLEKHGTYKNLFAAIEWLMPQSHGKWQPVASDYPLYRNQTILPVVISWPDTPTVYETMYMCKPDKVDYLANKPIYDTVHWRYITHSSKTLHESQRDYYYSNVYSLSRRLIEAGEEIQYLKRWLQQRNIRYVMFWAYGLGRNGEGMRKIITRALLPIIEKDPSFVPIKQFACGDAAEYSKNPVRGHPDIYGQYHITEYLFDYIAQHRLL